MQNLSSNGYKIVIFMNTVYPTRSDPCQVSKSNLLEAPIWGLFILFIVGWFLGVIWPWKRFEKKVQDEHFELMSLYSHQTVTAI